MSVFSVTVAVSPFKAVGFVIFYCCLFGGVGYFIFHFCWLLNVSFLSVQECLLLHYPLLSIQGCLFLRFHCCRFRAVCFFVFHCCPFRPVGYFIFHCCLFKTVVTSFFIVIFSGLLVASQTIFGIRKRRSNHRRRLFHILQQDLSRRWGIVGHSEMRHSEA